MATIAVVGSVNADMVLRVDRLPRPGETVLGHNFAIVGGGKGANQAMAARRAGCAVSLVGCIGDDVFGRQAIERLDAEDVDTHSVFRRKDSPSGVALILVDDSGENCIGIGPGANATLRPADVESAKAAIASADWLLVQLEIPLEAVERAVSIATENGVPIILNPAPARPLLAHMLKNIAILTPNRLEAETLTGVRVDDKTGARLAATRLHESGVATVIITMGADGVLVSSGSEALHLNAYAVNALDTTAAGDAFNGALAAALAERRPLYDAVRFANAAAAISVTRAGSQSSMPLRVEIEAFLRSEAERAPTLYADTKGVKS